MVLSADVTGVDFVSRSGSVKTSPVSIISIAVWEAIVCFHIPLNILFLNSIDVNAWSRIFVLDLWIDRVHIFDHIIHCFIVLRGFHVSKIITKSHKNLIMYSNICSELEIFIHLLSFFWTI